MNRGLDELVADLLKDVDQIKEGQVQLNNRMNLSIKRLVAIESRLENIIGRIQAIESKLNGKK
jgi:hypothetical protein